MSEEQELLNLIHRFMDDADPEEYGQLLGLIALREDLTPREYELIAKSRYLLHHHNSKPSINIFFNPAVPESIKRQVKDDIPEVIQSHVNRAIFNGGLTERDARTFLRLADNQDFYSVEEIVTAILFDKTLPANLLYLVLPLAQKYFNHEMLKKIAGSKVTPADLKDKAQHLLDSYELTGKPNLTREEEDRLIDYFYNVFYIVRDLEDRSKTLSPGFMDRLMLKAGENHKNVDRRLMEHLLKSSAISTEAKFFYVNTLLPKYLSALAEAKPDPENAELIFNYAYTKKESKPLSAIVRNKSLSNEDALGLAQRAAKAVQEDIDTEFNINVLAQIAGHYRLTPGLYSFIQQREIKSALIRLAGNPETPKEIIDSLDPSVYFRVAYHPATEPEARKRAFKELIRKAPFEVLREALTSPYIPDSYIIEVVNNPDSNAMGKSNLFDFISLRESISRELYEAVVEEYADRPSALLSLVTHRKDVPRDLKIRIMQILKDSEIKPHSALPWDYPEEGVQHYIQRDKRRIKEDPSLHVNELDLDIELLTGKSTENEILFQIKNFLQDVPEGEYTVEEVFSEAKQRLQELMTPDLIRKGIRTRNRLRERFDSVDAMPSRDYEYFVDHFKKVVRPEDKKYFDIALQEYFETPEPEPTFQVTPAETDLKEDLKTFNSRVTQIANRLKKSLGKDTFNLGDIDTILSDEVQKTDRFEVSLKHVPARESSQNYLRKNHFAIQVNLKRNELENLFEAKKDDVDPETGQTFEQWFKDLTETFLNHHILPFPGRTIAWARVHTLDEKTWLINEIQEDHHNVKGYFKALREGKSIIRDKDATSKQEEWIKYVIEHINEDYLALVMRAVLQTARKNGIKYIYMLPEVVQTHIQNKSKRDYVYNALPRRFYFHKVDVDLEQRYGVELNSDWYDETNPPYYWFRKARYIRKSTPSQLIKVARRIRAC